MSTSTLRRPKEPTTVTTKPTVTKTSRSTTPISERVISRAAPLSTGKENTNRPTSRPRAAAATKPQKPIVPPMTRPDNNKDTVDPRPRWSTHNKDNNNNINSNNNSSNSNNIVMSVRVAGRSSSPFDLSNRNRNGNGNIVIPDVRKTRVSRVSLDRNERSVSVGRMSRGVERSVGQQSKAGSKFPASKGGSLDKKDESLKETKAKALKSGNDSVNESVKKDESLNGSKAKEIKIEKDGGGVEKGKKEVSLDRECDSGSVSVMKVSESVKLFEKFRSKSCGLSVRASFGVESEESSDGRLSIGNTNGRLSRGSGGCDGLKEKGVSEDGGSGSSRSSGKYPSKLHGKLAFLEEKVKRIASDIKRTKEMLDLNNPDASKVMLSDIQETVAGIEKAMGDVVIGEKGESLKKGSGKVNGGDNMQIVVTKENGTVKESSDMKGSAKGLNTDELEARFFPHHKLLRDRSTLKAPSGSIEVVKPEVGLAVTVTKQEDKMLSKVEETCNAPLLSDSLSKGDSKVSVKGDLEICEVEETDGRVNSRRRDSSNTYSGKGNIDALLTANETLEDCDEEENKALMIYVEEIEDSFNNQLNEVGHKTSTGGWFVSEGESVLLAHDDGSCTFYDVANSEEKSIYTAPATISPNLWRDCWIVRAQGADGCSGRYVVAASAGNSMDSGFCSWDFYTKEIKSFHIEDGVTNTRTALAPVSSNVVLNRRHRQWWYKPCGPLICSTASNQKGVRIYDIRDGEHIMNWDVQSFVLEMENSSPLQWRNRGKVVLAETDTVSLWDVGSLTPEPLLSVSSNGKKITALHINNTDAELGGGVRQRVSSSEAEGNDGVYCTSDSINILDFRHPSGIGLKIPKHGTTVHSVFSRGDSVYLGCSGSSSSTRKPVSSAQIQQFSLRKQKLFTTYNAPESNAHTHYKAITQVWGNSDVTMGVCGSGLFVFDALNDDGSKLITNDHESGERVRETVGPDNLYCPSFDYMGSRALLISRDRPAFWKYLA